MGRFFNHHCLVLEETDYVNIVLCFNSQACIIANMGVLQMSKRQVMIVTGAGSGIGRATAYRLFQDGYVVVCADYNEKAAKETADEIIRRRGEAVAFRCDVSKHEQVEALVNFTVDTFGSLNGIVNNAGIGLVKPFLEMDPESYHKVIDVDQHGVYYGMYYTARKMVELKEKGTIINVASIYGFNVAAGSFNYHAAKAAVVIMTKSGGLELAPYDIRVVGVAPGFINTPILGNDQNFKDMLAKQHMRGRLIQPEDVAETIAFLASPNAWAINGTIVPVDDGFLAFK